MMAGNARGAAWRQLGASDAEQPFPDVLSHGPQTLVAYVLAVGRRNIAVSVAHDVAHGYEIPGFIADRLQLAADLFRPSFRDMA